MADQTVSYQTRNQELPAREPRSLRPRAITESKRQQIKQWLELLFIGLTLIVVLAAVLIVVSWGKVKLDDLRYGRPRTTQITAHVGHNETNGPTTLMAVNLNRRIAVIEIPGGDASKTRTIQGPYLVGLGEELTVAFLRLVDVNGDTHPDLLLRVKDEEFVYINDKGEFRLMTQGERRTVEQALRGAQ